MRRFFVMLARYSVTSVSIQPQKKSDSIDARHISESSTSAEDAELRKWNPWSPFSTNSFFGNKYARIKRIINRRANLLFPRTRGSLHRESIEWRVLEREEGSLSKKKVSIFSLWYFWPTRHDSTIRTSPVYRGQEIFRNEVFWPTIAPHRRISPCRYFRQVTFQVHSQKVQTRCRASTLYRGKNQGRSYRVLCFLSRWGKMEIKIILSGNFIIMTQPKTTLIDIVSRSNAQKPALQTMWSHRKIHFSPIACRFPILLAITRNKIFRLVFCSSKFTRNYF